MGLLDSVIEAAKQQYQTTKRGFGLLASNPEQFAQEATARYFPTKEEEAQFAQAQAAGGDYMQTPYYQKIMDLSQFQGSIKPTGLLQFDPRFDPRAKEQERLKNLSTTVSPTTQRNVPEVSLADFEGRPFITSMSDRTAAGGQLQKINDVTLNRPVGLLGGQDYMFGNDGQVWASAKGPVNQIMKNADIVKQLTGQDPLYIPWRMAPSGGDFAHMTGETMLSYASSAMNKTGKKAVDKEIKQFIPSWKGVDSPESVSQFREAPDKVRKAIKNMLDVNFRESGGLSIGEARLAVADPKQLVAPDAGIMNIGEIFTGKPVIAESGHPSYPKGIPGQGIGRVKEQRSIFELLPNAAKARGILDPTKPSQTDIRALQMKPYAGILDAKLLKSLGY